MSGQGITYATRLMKPKFDRTNNFNLEDIFSWLNLFDLYMYSYV